MFKKIRIACLYKIRFLSGNADFNSCHPFQSIATLEIMCLSGATFPQRFCPLAVELMTTIYSRSVPYGRDVSVI